MWKYCDNETIYLKCNFKPNKKAVKVVMQYCPLFSSLYIHSTSSLRGLHYWHRYNTRHPACHFAASRRKKLHEIHPAARNQCQKTSFAGIFVLKTRTSLENESSRWTGCVVISMCAVNVPTGRIGRNLRYLMLLGISL